MTHLHPILVLMHIVPLLLAAAGCSRAPKQAINGKDGTVATNPEDVRPLETGDKVPSVRVRNAKGDPLDLREQCLRQPTVLIFYRGGWCPYCTAHLAELGGVEKKLRNSGFQILAISPDRPRFLKSAADEQDYDYTLLSDSKGNAMRSFGLAFRVDFATVISYRENALDLEERSGETHHILPVPAAYLIDDNATVRYAHWNPDYKQRIDADKLLKAAREMTGASE